MSMPFGFSGSPIGAVALGGTTADGEQTLIIGSETPELVWPQPHTKAVMERLHLERFRFDVLARTSVLPFDDVAIGGDPPDFVVTLVEGSVEALDCAVLGLQRRRTSYRLFKDLRDKLLATADSRSFVGVQDCILTT